MLIRIRSILLLVVIVAVLAACGGSPALAVLPATYDFGEVAADAPVTATLQVSNTGQGKLTIDSITTSCGCTTAKVDEAKLTPGSVTNLTITFDPQAHPGLYGPLLRMVYLHSNDPAQPEVEVPVTVDILDPNEES